MKKHKPKLRLRKPFIVAISVFLLISVVSTLFVVLNNRSYEAATSKPVQQAPNVTNVSAEENILSNNDFVKRYRNFIDNVQKDNTVIYYANRFHLKEEKVLTLVKKLTKDYTNEKFLKTNVIGNSNASSFNSFEAGVAYFMRDLYRNPARYGTTDKDITATDRIETKQKVKGVIYMSNGLTFEQYYGKIADLFGVNKSIALAMVYHESGRMNSGLARNSNNIGGMRSGSGWMKFPTLEAGVIAHVLTVKSISEKNGFDIADPDGIYKFSGIYVHGSVNSPSEDWVNKVNWYKEKIDSKDVFTIK